MFKSFCKGMWFTCEYMPKTFYIARSLVHLWPEWLLCHELCPRSIIEIICPWTLAIPCFYTHTLWLFLATLECSPTWSTTLDLEVIRLTIPRSLLPIDLQRVYCLHVCSHVHVLLGLCFYLSPELIKGQRLPFQFCNSYSGRKCSAHSKHRADHFYHTELKH